MSKKAAAQCGKRIMHYSFSNPRIKSRFCICVDKGIYAASNFSSPPYISLHVNHWEVLAGKRLRDEWRLRWPRHEDREQAPPTPFRIWTNLILNIRNGHMLSDVGNLHFYFSDIKRLSNIHQSLMSVQRIRLFVNNMNWHFLKIRIVRVFVVLWAYVTDSVSNTRQL